MSGDRVMKVTHFYIQLGHSGLYSCRVTLTHVMIIYSMSELYNMFRDGDMKVTQFCRTVGHCDLSSCRVILTPAMIICSKYNPITAFSIEGVPVLYKSRPQLHNCHTR